MNFSPVITSFVNRAKVLIITDMTKGKNNNTPKAIRMYPLCIGSLFRNNLTKLKQKDTVKL